METIVMSFSRKTTTATTRLPLNSPVGALFATGSAIIILRMLLEDLIEQPEIFHNSLKFYENIVDLGHVFTCWWILILFIALALSVFLRRPFMELFSLSVIGLPVLLIVPFVDALFPVVGRAGIQYQTDLSTLPHTLLNLFNPMVSLTGITPGVRIEIALVLIAIPVGAHHILKKSWVTGILATIPVLITISIFGYLPAFFKFGGVPEFQGTESGNAVLFMRMLLIPLILLLTGIIFRLAHEQPGGWKLLRKAIYPSRMTAYGGAFLTGYFLVHLNIPSNPNSVFFMEFSKVATALLGIWFLFLSTKFRNDIIDLPADRISTPDRPLVTGELSIETANQLAAIFTAISFPLMIQGGENLFLFWLAFCGISHLYVSRYLNVRTIYPLGQGAIAALIVFLVLAGGELATPGGAVLAAQLNPMFIPGVFIMAFLVANLKDFRDLEGDRIAGYRSLPMLFSNPLNAVPWLIIGTTLIVLILALSVGISLPVTGGILSVYLIASFYSLRQISGLHEMDKITLLTIYTILSFVLAFILTHLLSP